MTIRNAQMLASFENHPTAPGFTAALTPSASATTRNTPLSAPREQSSMNRSASAIGRNWPRPVQSLLHYRLRQHCQCHPRHRRVREPIILNKKTCLSINQAIKHFHCIASIRKRGRHSGHLSDIQLPMHSAGKTTCTAFTDIG